MKNSLLPFFLLALLCGNARADDQRNLYVAAGPSVGGHDFSIGIGTKADVLEFSSIKLGTVDGNSNARFVGLSLVQNTTPVNHFNMMFRLGFGEATTTFPNGASATRTGYSNGVFFGLGAQYQFDARWSARAEVKRISYAASAGDATHGASYPLTLSALFNF